MKASELIEKLKQFDGDLEVYVWDSEHDILTWIVSVREKEHERKGIKERYIDLKTSY